MESLAAGPLTRGLTAQNLDGKRKEHAVGNYFFFFVFDKSKNWHCTLVDRLTGWPMAGGKIPKRM